MADSVMIQGTKNGANQYGNIILKPGTNTLTAEEYETLSSDEGFKKLVAKGYYVELTAKEVSQSNEISTLKSGYESKLSSMKEKYEADISEIEEAAESELSSLKSENAQKVAELATELRKSKESADSIQKELNAMKKENASLKKDNAALQKEIEKLKKAE